MENYIIKISSPDSYTNEREYLYHVIFHEFFGIDFITKRCDGHETQISVMNYATSNVIHLPDVLFLIAQEDWLTDKCMPQRPITWHDLPSCMSKNLTSTERLPVLFKLPSARSVPIEYQEGGVYLSVDLLGSIFFILTRLEEIIEPRHDGHCRFIIDQSILASINFIERPLVNEYLEVLWTLISGIAPGIKRAERKPRLFLSHDVDRPWVTYRQNLPRVLKNILADLTIRRDPWLAGRRCKALLSRCQAQPDRDPANTFDLLMEASEEAGVRCSFNFLCGSINNNYDSNYNIHDIWIRKLILNIHKRGHEIGLHGSYETLSNSTQLKDEFSLLKMACFDMGVDQNLWGGRQHYLRWKAPITWQAWEDAGLDYDSTLGIANGAGFRVGICYEFTVFNVCTRKHLKLKERPLIVMDTALLRPRNTALLESAINRLYEQTLRFNGDFTLLWHNNNLMSHIECQAHLRIMNALNAKKQN